MKQSFEQCFNEAQLIIHISLLFESLNLLCNNCPPFHS